jgi:hypothetical protein
LTTKIDYKPSKTVLPEMKGLRPDRIARGFEGED